MTSDVTKFLLSTITATAWKKVGIKHHHGLNIPLSSIRTKQSCGIGEYYDLIPFIDWSYTLKMNIIQLLPLNESNNDPSPYNALSSTALHPIYLSLHALPYLDAHPSLKAKLEPMRHFNHTKLVHYHDVIKEKMNWLREYVALTGDQIRSEKEYSLFLSTHTWLPFYSLFKVFKERYNHVHWELWPEEHRNITKTKCKEYEDNYSSEILFYNIVQYLCFSQLTTVKAYAEKKGVFLKGDIPYLVNSDSVDVWIHREFFDLSEVAGAPPDEFNKEGQYWGFPLYNWTALSQNHYSWWKNRFDVASHLYHLYRIDHIAGFFRIWAIPHHQPAVEGKYVPFEDSIAMAHGEKMLDLLVHFSEMLPIGEDLGAVPPYVRKCLEDYGICGTKIFRMERYSDEHRSFIPYSQYSPISMSSVSTHDLDTVTLWWKNSPEEAKDYALFKNWVYHEKLTWEQRFEILYDIHHTPSLFHINLLQEYLSLVPDLTWENPEDERINYPGTVQQRNWNYRYKEPLETLMTDPRLQAVFQKLLHEQP